MSKFENFVDMKKLNELLQKKDVELAKLYKLLGKKEAIKEEEEEKKFNALLWILAIIGVIVAVAGICYAVYRYFTPDYLDDFDDDFDEEFDEIEKDDEESEEDDDSMYEDEEEE
ncbi:MAG: hypothetical protein IKS85_07845 [Lachnospiraceae bacterium]|nr:hypothetical protein [Lachnospiraceae bacterium]